MGCQTLFFNGETCPYLFTAMQAYLFVAFADGVVHLGHCACAKPCQKRTSQTELIESHKHVQ